MKPCNVCSNEKELCEFSIRRASNDGLSYTCKACTKERTAKHYKNNKPLYKERALKWNRDNTDKRRKITKKCLKKNKLKYSERVRIQQKKRYHRLLEIHGDELREKLRSERKRWKDNNPEKVKESSERYKNKDPERYRLKTINDAHLRRVRKISNGYERFSLEDVIIRDGMICHICGLEVTRELLEFDHVKPISRGGSHTFENVRVSHKKCNRVKWAN